MNPIEQQYQIQRWLCYFRENKTYYGRAVEEIHRLGCYDYDAEFLSKKNKLYADNILSRATKEIKNNKLSSIKYYCEKLKDMGYMDYIEKIIEMLEAD